MTPVFRTRPLALRALHGLFSFFFLALILAAALALPPAAGAGAGSLTVSAQIPGSFSVQAVNVMNVKAWNMTFYYDADNLSNPGVAVTPQLRRGTFMLDTSGPGAITVTSSSPQPFNYAGNLLHLTFSLPTGQSGKITGASVYVTRGNEVYEALPVSINDPPDLKKGQDGDSGGQEKKTDVPNPAKQPDQVPLREREDGETPAIAEIIAPADRSGRGVVQGGSTQGLEGRRAPYQLVLSVLDQFRKFGTLTDTPALLEIIRNHRDQVFQQDPAAVVSDGKRSVMVTVRLEHPGEKMPLFLLRGAHFVRFKNEGSSDWVLELVPHPGVLQASISVYFENRALEFPLTVAPPLEWHLGTRGKAGQLDYLDRYVLLVNEFAVPK